MKRAVSLTAAALILLSGAIAAAQTRPAPQRPTARSGPPRAPRFEIAVGLLLDREVALGESDALETTSSGPPATLFRTSTDLQRTWGPLVRLNVRARRNLEAEIFASFTRPRLSTTISDDSETTETVTASEALRRYTIGGGALWYWPRRNQAAALRPFIAGGVAYLREMHEANTLASTGRTYDAGVGAKYYLRSGTTARPGRYGIRGDARVEARSRGVAFDDDLRFGPALSVSLFARF
jgi:hypothetical protein